MRRMFCSVRYMVGSSRVMTPEIMDQPDVDGSAHALALEGLRRINKASRAARQIAHPILAMAQRRGLRRISLLDVACGGGDVPIGVALAAREAGLEIDLTLLDRSTTALNIASEAAERAGFKPRFVQREVSADLPVGEFDVITSSLFLHHLEKKEQVVSLLARMRARAARLIVVSDLRRGAPGLLAAWLGSRVLSRSEIVHHDAPASVRAAWTMEELSLCAYQAAIPEARVLKSWPFRMLLIWESKGAA